MEMVIITIMEVDREMETITVMETMASHGNNNGNRNNRGGFGNNQGNGNVGGRTGNHNGNDNARCKSLNAQDFNVLPHLLVS